MRELLPQLRTGKITRGVIGVQVLPVPADALAEFGLKERRGALVARVNPRRPRGQGRPRARRRRSSSSTASRCSNRDELVGHVVATKPGTTVPVKVLRDKQEKTLNVTVDELEPRRRRRRARRAAAAVTSASPKSRRRTGFGITLGALTPDVARRLRLPADTEGVLITDVEQGSPAFRAGLLRGDIILQVNRRDGHARRPRPAALLGQVPIGSTAFLLRPAQRPGDVRHRPEGVAPAASRVHYS